jgi:hypothetical protein
LIYITKLNKNPPKVQIQA